EREANPRVRVIFGPRIGPVGVSNTIPHLYRDPRRIYGMIPDDSLFLSAQWDRYLIDAFEHMKGRIGVVSAAHSGGDYVNYPWVSREWIEVVGWYYYAPNFHHCGDSILEILGECTGTMVYAPAAKFFMHHDLLHEFNRDKMNDDAFNFLIWC